MISIKKGLKIMMLSIAIVALFSTQTSFAAATLDDTYGKILADNKVITGFNGDLMEDKNISRVEMVAILSKLYPTQYAEFVPPTIPTFDDVKTTHWGFKYVEFAYAQGITKGKSAHTFGVKDLVTYNQVSIFLIKALGFDLNGIKYETAATEIADAFGLKLLVPSVDSQTLLRSDVFELMVKALLLDDVFGIPGIEMLTSNTVLMETFFNRSVALINTPVAIYVGDGFYNIYYANGDLYTGEFDGSFPKGNGVLKFADGNLYIGQFEKGMFQGYGILIWPEGDYYEGKWANDAYNGLGIYTFLDGSYQYGEWVNDSLIKPIEEVTPEQIEAGTAIASKNYTIHLTGVDGLALSGIAIKAVDESNVVTYNLISDSNGNVEFPKVGDFAIISLSLSENSAYRFSLSKDAYMVTTVGTYKSGVTFELIK